MQSKNPSRHHTPDDDPGPEHPAPAKMSAPSATEPASSSTKRRVSRPTSLANAATERGKSSRGLVKQHSVLVNAIAFEIRIMLIMELKQLVNEVRRYHEKQKKQLMTGSTSPRRRRSLRNGADADVPLGDALQGDDSSTLRPEA